MSDWSWLSERKRCLSERALFNEQQRNDAAEVAANKKRTRDLKKKKGGELYVVDGGDIPDMVPDRNISESYVGAASSPTNRKLLKGMDDPAITAALTAPQLVIDSLVPQCWLEGLKHYLGGNAMHLLADLDFETPDCIRDVNKAIASDISASSSSTVTTSSLASSQLASVDALESWVADAQLSLVAAVMKALLGGCGRLKRALSTLGQKSPESLRVWNLLPESLYQRLLEYDPGLSDICLSRLHEGGLVQDNFSLDWVRWMCTVCEDMRSSQSVLWLIHYAVDEEGDGNEDDEDEDEDVVADDNKNLWLTVPDDLNRIGCSVRCYPLSDDYWDDGKIVGYLPPDTEEPLALWRVKGIRRNVSTSHASSLSSSSSSNCTDNDNSKIWIMDLDENELTCALALHATK